VKNPFSLVPSLACKIGSIVVHAEEMMSPSGHGFDKIALEALLRDGEVQAWLATMRGVGMLPVKREVTLRDAPMDRAIKDARARKK
jgi:hypothetical protein